MSLKLLIVRHFSGFSKSKKALDCIAHTTSPSASRAVRQKRIRVHRIPPHVRDDRETPLVWDGMAHMSR
jgi:hypothetical protein